ncbi:MAG: hypothetical protein NC308_00865 [Clostridium sp.]|nr:hypothetical protein [Bacteroides sp.]MCM1197415.1 hypothetical protein [Clostridium sp.]
MKRLFLLFLFPALLLLPAGCQKDNGETALKVQSITSTLFDHNGGLGSIVADVPGDGGLAAESSSPEWLRVQVRNNIVLYNVAGYTGTEDRSATVTLTCGKCAPVNIEFTQTGFVGLSVVVRSVELTNDRREQIVEVVSSGDYSVIITDDPGKVFSFRKVEEGVCFSTSRSQGNKDITARATLKPEDESAESVDILLTIPQKSMYDYILGTWKVESSDVDGLEAITFTARVRPDSFNMSFGITSIQDYPVLARFVDDMVVVASGQELGKDASKFWSLHYNGTVNGNGWYIFNTPGRVAWGAVPEFNDVDGKITLTFSDNGQGISDVAKSLNIWGCSGSYFNFGSGVPVVSTERLVLSKSYTE